MFTTIRKRDGREVPFDDSKITDAIFKAARAVGGEDRELAVSLTLDVLRMLKQEYNGQIFGVEDVQDVVEKVLIERGHARTAKAYILYRDKRTRIRDAKTELMDIVEDIIKETDRDNANVGNSPSAKMLQIASAASRNYYLMRLLDEDYSLAHRRGDIHIHDLDFYATTLNCVPDFEYTMIRDCNGETSWVRFDYFDQFFEKYRERIQVIDDVEVLPLDGYQVYGRTGWTKIRKVMRRFMRDEESLYAIKTRKGLSLHLTGNHRVPVIRNNKEIIICAQEIKKGDKLLNSKHEFDEAFEIPVLDLFIDRRDQIPYGVTIRNAHKLIHWLRYRYGDFKFKLTVGAKQSRKGGSILDGHEYAKIIEKYEIPYDVKRELSITTTKAVKSLPAFLPITPELMRLLGYILSEGSLRVTSSSRSIVIGNEDPAILADIDHCVRAVFNDDTTKIYKDAHKKIEKGRIINGSVYVAFLNNVLNIKSNAGEIDIPDFVMQAPPELIGHFIQGLFDGDGHYGDSRISYCTASKNLARKLVLLLRSIGVESSLVKQNAKGSAVVLNGEPAGTRNYDNYIVNILDVSNLQSFLLQIPSYKDISRTAEYAFTVQGRKLDALDVMQVNIKNDYHNRVYDLETEEHWFMVNDYVVHNCLQIPLDDLLRDGFDNGHGFIRPPKRPASATALAAIILQSSQNDMYGGQSFPFFDTQMAPFIDGNSEEDVYQAMEALVYNLNSMHSRAGSQVPFSSLNLGTDTSEVGRKITRNLLLAYEAGLGKGENPIFPNVIFRLKKGVNFNPEDPNYDLFQLAVRVASKRLNPTFSFMDSSFNKEYGDQVAYMGCRTRVMANRRGPAVTARRGNLSFTTINLPRLAIKAERNIKRFYSLLDELTELTINQLYHRFKVQCRLRVKDIPFVMGQGLYLGSEDLKPDDSIEHAIVNGTLSVGIIGLAEALVALTGYHHGQSEDSHALGLEIMEHIRDQVDEACERFDLNYTFLATPAEGLCGRFVAMDRKEFKLIPGVTDREYYTNSFHIPVYYPISMFDKIRIEGEYHKYFNAGHISYVELSSPPQHNPQAVEDLIRHMADCDMGYAGINYPVDFCCGCNMLGVFNDPECPRCGSTNIRRVRRITGYLSTVDRFNDGKVAELRDRLPHG